jgi:hypothetical protein
MLPKARVPAQSDIEITGRARTPLLPIPYLRGWWSRKERTDG